MSEHSRVSPSKAPLWLNCPGSVAMTQDIPFVQSDAAALGTRAHGIVEEVLRKFDTDREQDIIALLDTQLESHQPMVQHREHLLFYLEEIEKLLLQHPDGVLYIEQRLSLAVWDVELFGTADAIIVTDSKVFIIDFKFGFVPVTEPIQLKTYALGFVGSRHSFDSLCTLIIQPRLAQGQVKSWEYTPEEILAYGQRVQKAIALVRTTSMLTYGSWCDKYYCDARTTCKAYQAQLGEVLMGVTELPDPESFTDEELKARFIQLKANKKMYDGLEKYLKAYAKSSPEDAQNRYGAKIISYNGPQAFKKGADLSEIEANDDAWILKSPSQLIKAKVITEEELEPLVSRSTKEKLEVS